MGGFAGIIIFIIVALFVNTGSSKTVCTRLQYSISNTNFYQRIELPTAVACVERCIENADYCRSVIYVEQRESKPPKRFCQLYGVNSESRNIRIRPEANYEPKVTLYELLDECPPGYGTDEYGDNIMDQIATNLKKTLLAMPKGPREDYGTANKEIELYVNDDVHKPVFDSRNNGDFGVSGSSFSSKPDYPFNSKFSGENQEDSSFSSNFHPERDPVPIQPVSVSHAGFGQQPAQTPFGQTQFGRYPCFSPTCRSNYYVQPQQSPCAAIRRGDPCAPKPRCGPPPLSPCESFSLPEKVTVESKPYWTEWSPSGTCSVTCGHGVRQRKRFCSTGKDSDCEGEPTKEEPCELPECDIWSEWGAWSSCSASCGGGEQQRSRYCRNGRNCVGPAEEKKTCADVDCPHWSSWSSWHDCSASCGQGLSKRMRECLPLGSYACPGLSQEHQNCELRPCPEWGPWQQWTECTKSCDGGERQRIRECLHGSDCSGPAEEHILCNQQPCPIWSEWSYWSQCSATCGDDGTKLRTRSCRYEGFPSNLCEGTAQDQSACQLEECPYWDEWTSWSACTATCGHGQQTRARKCLPRGYGCQGGDKELKFCQLAVCPFYDTWSEWGGCSVTCGRGTCERTRKCVKNDPLPGAVLPSEDELEESESKAEDATDSNRRAALKGRLIERAQMLENRRGVNDQESRRRPHLREQKLEVSQTGDRRFAPKRAGNRTTLETSDNLDSLECAGPSVDRKECDAGPCCDWSSWASWSSCNAACGTGSKVRSRMCQVDVGFSSFTSPSLTTFGQGQQRYSYQVDPNFGSSWGQQQFPSSVQPIHPQVSFRGKRQAWNWPPRNPTYVTPSSFQSQVPTDARCNCEGPSVETEVCTTSECVEAQADPCSWSQWSEWCSCSGNCQQGIKARTRFCNKGNSPRRFGRNFDSCDCPGEKVQTADCIPESCSNQGRPRGALFSERDSIVQKSDMNSIGQTSVVKKAKHRTDEKPSDFIIKTEDEELENFDSTEDEEDEVTSCSWSDWSDWSKCGSDFLKQRTRFCVGLKALINNCECKGATMEQTSCRPGRDGHNFKPPSKAVLEVSRDILREKLARSGNKQHDDPSTPQEQPRTKIRPAGNSTGTRILSGSELITANDVPDFKDKDFPQLNCTFNEWENWSKCDANCGEEGERRRQRTCPCESCPGVSVEIESCTGDCHSTRKNPFD